jgi:hypothetical protein
VYGKHIAKAPDLRAGRASNPGLAGVAALVGVYGKPYTPIIATRGENGSCEGCEGLWRYPAYAQKAIYADSNLRSLPAPALIPSNPEEMQHNEKTDEQSYHRSHPRMIEPGSQNGNEYNRQDACFDSFEKIRSHR